MLKHHIANLNRRTLQYQENDTVNNGNVGVKLTDTQEKVYSLIRENSGITHLAIAQALSITSRTAERATKTLKTFGLLRREGSDKTGK